MLDLTHTHTRKLILKINSSFGKIYIKCSDKGSMTIRQRPFGCREVMKTPMFIL